MGRAYNSACPGDVNTTISSRLAFKSAISPKSLATHWRQRREGKNSFSAEFPVIAKGIVVNATRPRDAAKLSRYS
jgi:hypothetical protein